jgi:hypothetical protein
MPNNFILQISLIVRDVPKAVQQYEELLGIGPFSVFTVDTRELPGVTYRGQPGDYRVRVGMARAGTGIIELIESQRGSSIYSEFLEKHGEGLHHIGLILEDFSSIDKNLVNHGLKPSQDGPIVGKERVGRFTYFDTEPQLGAILELLDVPEDIWVKWVSGSSEYGQGPQS